MIMDKLNVEEVLQLAEKKNEDMAKEIEKVHENLTNLEEHFSDAKFREYENVTQKLSKMLGYEEKGSEKISIFDQKTQQLNSRSERLDGHIKAKIEENEELKKKLEKLQNIENTTTELARELGLTFEPNNDGTLALVFKDDSPDAATDRLVIQLGKEKSL